MTTERQAVEDSLNQGAESLYTEGANGSTLMLSTFLKGLSEINYYIDEGKKQIRREFKESDNNQVPVRSNIFSPEGRCHFVVYGKITQNKINYYYFGLGIFEINSGAEHQVRNPMRFTIYNQSSDETAAERVIIEPLSYNQQFERLPLERRGYILEKLKPIKSKYRIEEGSNEKLVDFTLDNFDLPDAQIKMVKIIYKYTWLGIEKMQSEVIDKLPFEIATPTIESGKLSFCCGGIVKDDGAVTQHRYYYFRGYGTFSNTLKNNKDEQNENSIRWEIIASTILGIGSDPWQN